MKLKTLIIDESRWARGGENGAASLLNHDGNRCCLGFLGEACGAADSQLADCGQPGDTAITSEYWCYWTNLANVNWPKGLTFRDDVGNLLDTELSNKIATVNDDGSITDAERKQQLKPLFRKLGWRIKYVKGAP